MRNHIARLEKVLAFIAYLEECLNYELSKIDESLYVFDVCEVLLN